MKHVFTTLLLCIILLAAHAQQWSTSGTNIYNANTGTVGIGTGTTPYTSFKFNVQAPGSTSVAGSLALFTSGSSVTAGNFYGIQVDKNSANSLLLGINKNSLTGSTTGLQLPSNIPFISSYSGALSIGRGNGYGLPNTSDIMITSGGFVGIGTNNPQVQLAVKGTVYCTRLKVTPLTNTTDWPDYVFADDYKLISLDSVETYVKAWRHLPDVPSAQEVADSGIDVADNQKAMLQKIEELTLYIIQLQKELKTLTNKVDTLQSAGKKEDE